jgi:hypothetical protein
MSVPTGIAAGLAVAATGAVIAATGVGAVVILAGALIWAKVKKC